MEKSKSEKSIPNAAEAIHTAGQSGVDAGRKAILAYAEATASVGAGMDRLVRAQMGHAAAATKETADFVAQSFDGALKAGEAIRRAGVEMLEASTASFVR